MGLESFEKLIDGFTSNETRAWVIYICKTALLSQLAMGISSKKEKMKIGDSMNNNIIFLSVKFQSLVSLSTLLYCQFPIFLAWSGQIKQKMVNSKVG